MTTRTTNPIVQRFNEIPWHDSKLLSVYCYKADGEDRVKLSLELLGDGGTLTSAELVFKECGFFVADVFLAAKSMCADDISGAECYESSDWKKTVSEPQPFDVIQGNRGLDHHLHFRISVIPPGGTINLLAKDFELLDGIHARS
ncbi:MAG: hypothetical protein WBG54_07205 [Acidobacteriaceae bacterium]